MFALKKYFQLISMLCLLTIFLSFQCLGADESLDRTPSNQQKIMGKQAPAQNQPKISIDSYHYDAGEVYEGDELIHTFIVKNTGTAELNIKNVKPG